MAHLGINMNNDIEKDFNLGGSIDRALSGDYELKATAVFQEAWKHTISHFLSFSPAIVALMFVQLAIFYIALKLQLGDPAIILDAVIDPEAFTPQVVESIFIANFSYEVISAPIYAGICLMAMSHVRRLTNQSASYRKRFTVHGSSHSRYFVQPHASRHRRYAFAIFVYLLLTSIQQFNSADL